MAYGKCDGIPMPNMSAVEITRQLIGDRGRTAGGKLRQDTVAVKRKWAIQCIYLTAAQAKALTDYWDSLLYAPVQFWLYEFGSEAFTVLAMVDADSVEEVLTPFTDDMGVRHKDGRSLFFSVEEV